MTDLKRCPFCGEHRAEIRGEDIVCVWCFARTPIDIWNTRADLPNKHSNHSGDITEMVKGHPVMGSAWEKRTQNCSHPMGFGNDRNGNLICPDCGASCNITTKKSDTDNG